MPGPGTQVPIEQLIEALDRRLSSTEGRFVDRNPLSEPFLREVLQAIDDLGFCTVSKHLSVEASRINDFERIVAQYNANDTVEPADVNGGSVLQALASDGWIVLPPT